MNLTYPINFVGQDEWMKANIHAIWAVVTLSPGTVKFLGSGAPYDTDDKGGRYEFITDESDGSDVRRRLSVS